MKNKKQKQLYSTTHRSGVPAIPRTAAGSGYYLPLPPGRLAGFCSTGRGGSRVAVLPIPFTASSMVPACVRALNDVTEGPSMAVRMCVRLSFPGLLVHNRGVFAVLCGARDSQLPSWPLAGGRNEFLRPRTCSGNASPVS